MPDLYREAKTQEERMTATLCILAIRDPQAEAAVEAWERVKAGTGALYATDDNERQGIVVRLRNIARRMLEDQYSYVGSDIISLVADALDAESAPAPAAVHYTGECPKDGNEP